MNFRVSPDVLSRVLPEPFRPKLVKGFGMAGICLIRLKGIRPRFWPAWAGLSSENAAHRIAVEWDEGGALREGVYVPRRDSPSLWNKLAGGRLFPGVHHRSRFHVRETGDSYHVELSNRDGTRLLVSGHLTESLPGESVFGTLEQASRFFEGGSVGYSATGRPGVFDGLELKTLRWAMQPLAVEKVESSYFANWTLFPAGSVEFDCALLMRRIEHEWRGRPRLVVRGCEPAGLSA